MFGDVVRQHRIEAGLTQDQLAERAGLSTKAVSAIERGARRRPYPTTALALAKALALSGAALEEFQGVAARGRGTSRAVSLGTLPLYGTSYIPRRNEQLELTGLLKNHPVVTVIGAGGTGKTRLALQVAGELQSSLYDTVLFFDCGSLSDSNGTADAVLDAIMRTARLRRSLVLLDGCEGSIVTVCRIITSLRHLSSGVGVLATSRQRLRISDEMPYALRGFAVHDAVRLFRDRALARDRGFDLSPHVNAVVADICDRLEGVPLAIELAAARIGTLGVFEIRDELFRNYSILATRNRDLPDRQQSFSANVDWSLTSLDSDEREMLSRLTAFRRSFTFDGAVAVLRDAVSERSPMALLASLIEKSLVSVDPSGAAPRYRLSEPTRAFVRDHRTDARTLAASSRGHANWLAELADDADGTYLRVPHGTWMGKMGSWLDDARTAVTWSLGGGNDPRSAGRIIGGLRGMWRTAGLASECRRWVEATLPLLDAREHPAMVGRLYRALAQASTGFRRLEAAGRSKALAEALGDRVAVAASLTMVTEGLLEIGEYTLALETVNRNARLIEGEGLRHSLLYARTFYDRSLIFRALGQTERVAGQVAEAMGIAGVTGDDWVALDVRAVSADEAFDSGKATDAIAVSKEALQHARGLGWDVFVVSFLNSTAAYELSLNRIEEALGSAANALTLSRGRDRLGFDASVRRLATIAALRGHHEQAALLYGFAEKALAQMTYILPRSERIVENALLSRLRDRLEAEQLRALYRAGRSLTESVAADLALAAASA